MWRGRGASWVQTNGDPGLVAEVLLLSVMGYLSTDGGLSLIVFCPIVIGEGFWFPNSQQ